MATVYSNELWLELIEPLQQEKTGWDVVVLDQTSLVGGPTKTAAHIYTFTSLSGNKTVNDIGAGSITLPKNHPVLKNLLPSPLVGNLMDREYLWQFYKDGALRFEWFGEDVLEDVASDGSLQVTISGRSSENCLSWGCHVPAWGERQDISVPVAAKSGALTLKFGGDATTPIPYNASAASFKSIVVDSVAAISAADISVTKWEDKDEDGVTQAHVWTVSFIGKFASGNNFAPGFVMRLNTIKDNSGENVFVEISGVDNYDVYQPTTKHAPAAVWLDCLARVQARGILTFLDVTFSTTKDSFGNSWAATEIIELSPGETLLEMLQRLSEAYDWEWRMLPGFILQVVQGRIGSHKEQDVVFWLGKDQISHEVARTTRDVATDVWAQSGDLYVNRASGTSMVFPLRREVWVDGGSGMGSYAQTVANQTLGHTLVQKRNRTVDIPFDIPGKSLFVDFDCADFISIEDGDYAKVVERVKSVSWSVAGEGTTDMELVLYDN